MSVIEEPHTQVDLAISGMTCASCVARVEKKLNKVPGVEASVNLATEQAHITLSDPEVSTDSLLAAVEKAGYGAQLISRVEPGQELSEEEKERGNQVQEEADEQARAHIRSLARRFVLALVLSVPVVALSMVPAWQFTGWQWLVAALATVVAFGCGRHFHVNAFKAARHGSGTMDTLVSLGVLASMLYSYVALFFLGAGKLGYTMSMGHMSASVHMPHLYFESAAMIVTFLLLGRFLEGRSRRGAGDALRALLNLQVEKVQLVRRADGTATDAIIPLSQLQVGDVFLVKPGERIASDGVVVSGASAVDASVVTGESVPVDVSEGSDVTGATLNTWGSLHVRTTRVGEDTMIATMGRLLVQAQSGKAKIQRLADRISEVFVRIVLTLSALTFLAWLLLASASLEDALTAAITVLVVACPCALGLATPTALLVGSSRAARSGILMSGAQVLENAHNVTTVVFDKTGTLTTGTMQVRDVMSLAGVPTQKILEVATALESQSEHPLAQAIVRYGAKALEDSSRTAVEDFRAEAGLGVSGIVNGTRAYAGRLSWLQSLGFTAPEHDVPEGCSLVYVAWGDPESADAVVAGAFALADTPREHAAEALDQLRRLGMKPVLLTGDTPQAAKALAKQLGIEDVHAGVLPGQKVDVVHSLQAAGERVAMVGDGVNDAAALATADLSLAMGSGTDVAKAASDLTIVNSDIRAIPAAMRISRATRRIVKENLAWAFGYNVIAIPLAAFGIIVPAIAAATMASSSVIVVLNSLRLYRLPLAGK